MTGRLLALLALLVTAGLLVAGCGGGSDEDGGQATSAPAPATAPEPAPEPEPEPAPAPEPEPAPEPLPGLPADTAGYDGWLRLNADPIPPDSAQTRRVGFDAHRGTKNVYVNQPRARLAGGAYPNGSIVVKEADSGGVITLVAIMRKIQGIDPAHGDWEFVEYKRGGADEPFATSASLRDGTCWGCHGIAQETDWVFTPLDP